MKWLQRNMKTFDQSLKGDQIKRTINNSYTGFTKLKIYSTSGTFQLQVKVAKTLQMMSTRNTWHLRQLQAAATAELNVGPEPQVTTSKHTSNRIQM